MKRVYHEALIPAYPKILRGGGRCQLQIKARQAKEPVGVSEYELYRRESGCGWLEFDIGMYPGRHWYKFNIKEWNWDLTELAASINSTIKNMLLTHYGWSPDETEKWAPGFDVVPAEADGYNYLHYRHQQWPPYSITSRPDTLAFTREGMVFLEFFGVRIRKSQGASYLPEDAWVYPCGWRTHEKEVPQWCRLGQYKTDGGIDVRLPKLWDKYEQFVEERKTEFAWLAWTYGVRSPGAGELDEDAYQALEPKKAIKRFLRTELVDRLVKDGVITEGKIAFKENKVRPIPQVRLEMTARGRWVRLSLHFTSDLLRAMNWRTDSYFQYKDLIYSEINEEGKFILDFSSEAPPATDCLTITRHIGSKSGGVFYWDYRPCAKDAAWINFKQCAPPTDVPAIKVSTLALPHDAKRYLRLEGYRVKKSEKRFGVEGSDGARTVVFNPKGKLNRIYQLNRGKLHVKLRIRHKNGTSLKYTEHLKLHSQWPQLVLEEFSVTCGAAIKLGAGPPAAHRLLQYRLLRELERAAPGDLPVNTTIAPLIPKFGGSEAEVLHVPFSLFNDLPSEGFIASCPITVRAKVAEVNSWAGPSNGWVGELDCVVESMVAELPCYKLAGTVEEEMGNAWLFHEPTYHYREHEFCHIALKPEPEKREYVFSSTFPRVSKHDFSLYVVGIMGAEDLAMPLFKRHDLYAVELGPKSQKDRATQPKNWTYNFGRIDSELTAEHQSILERVRQEGGLTTRLKATPDGGFLMPFLVGGAEHQLNDEEIPLTLDFLTQPKQPLNLVIMRFRRRTLRVDPSGAIRA